MVVVAKPFPLEADVDDEATSIGERLWILKDGKPGDHPDAPYRKEHFFATNIERMIALELGVDWAQYDQKVMSL